MTKQSSIKILRFIPLVTLAIVSLWVAAGLSVERRPFHFDFDMSSYALRSSLHKVEHFKATALVFLLAWLAFGNRRLILAFVLTILVGIGWEIAESTAIGHTARLSDLAPDLVAAVSCLLVAMFVRRSSPMRRGDNSVLTE
jgi:hypothetical protein